MYRVCIIAAIKHSCSQQTCVCRHVWKRWGRSYIKFRYVSMTQLRVGKYVVLWKTCWQQDGRFTVQPTPHCMHDLFSSLAHMHSCSLAPRLKHQTGEEEGGMLLWRPAENYYRRHLASKGKSGITSQLKQHCYVCEGGNSLDSCTHIKNPLMLSVITHVSLDNYHPFTKVWYAETNSLTHQ